MKCKSFALQVLALWPPMCGNRNSAYTWTQVQPLTQRHLCLTHFSFIFRVQVFYVSFSQSLERVISFFRSNPESKDYFNDESLKERLRTDHVSTCVLAELVLFLMKKIKICIPRFKELTKKFCHIIFMFYRIF